LAVGVDPQADQQLRIESRAPAGFFAARNARVEALQIQASHQIPDGPRHVVLLDQLLHIHRSPAHLLAVDPAD